MDYYLGIDIGASSGRHILGHLESGKMLLEEIYRFPNGNIEKDGEKCWDTEALFREILTGMKKCALLGKIPKTVGIDTWAVDFALLDKNNQLLGNVVAYRDDRTEGMDQRVYEVLSEQELYQRTGIQKQKFNTIYQLMALKEKRPELLGRAESLLMIPDYFHFLLTGKKVQEYTNASTSQLLDPETKNWDYELMEKLGFPKKIFPEIKLPGTKLGRLLPEIEKEIGYSCELVLPATHDTASAVAAVPVAGENALYISSGTWSLMGIERKEADRSEESRRLNFTSEGGVDYRFRYLKNIMGLWMIQSMRRELCPELSFGEICRLAEESRITSVVDANDGRFLAPKSMTEEVQSFCRETAQQVPESVSDMAAVIYRSLALCYKKTAEELEERSGRSYPCIHVIGGGANADYLNKLTADCSGKEVLAGPTEATAIGNLLVQMRADGRFRSLSEARACVASSFPIKSFKAEE